MGHDPLERVRFARHLRHYRRGGRIEWGEGSALRRGSGRPSNAAADASAHAVAAATLPAENPLDALKRSYVDGAITVEQYEAELDRLFAGGRTHRV